MKAKTQTKENPGEMYFRWYLEELKRYGYVKEIHREPETIKVLPDYIHKREKHFKQKENEFEEFTLLKGVNYTYDFRVIWDASALNIFTDVFDPNGAFKYGQPLFISHYININGTVEIVSYVDVKPHISAAQFGGGKLSSYYSFPFIQKMLMLTRKLYINKAIPTNQGKHGINTCLFAISFTPNKYLFTDTGQKQRKIHFKKTTITAFAKRKLAVIEDLQKQEQNKKGKNSQTSLL